MALNVEKGIPTPYGEARYMRIRNIVLWRDPPGAVSNFRPENQPVERLQVDFELFMTKEARDNGGTPVPGVWTYTVPADDVLNDELIAKIYAAAKKHSQLAEATDI